MVEEDGFVHGRKLERMILFMADSWRRWLCPWQMDVEDGFVTYLCPWRTVGEDSSYVHVSWFMSMMDG